MLTAGRAKVLSWDRHKNESLVDRAVGPLPFGFDISWYSLVDSLAPPGIIPGIRKIDLRFTPLTSRVTQSGAKSLNPDSLEYPR